MIIRSNGCLLPSLIVLNLFFGRIFFSLKHWLIIEGVLILLFMLSAYIFTRQFLASATPRRGNVVDIEGEVIQEKEALGHSKGKRD